jgi:hypothetical protein
MCAACTNQSPLAELTAAVGPNSAQASVNSGAGTAAETRMAAKKTLAAKVLAAIALERVTGRKPDPSRLIQ